MCKFAQAISIYTDSRSSEELLVGGRMSFSVLEKFRGLNKEIELFIFYMY